MPEGPGQENEEDAVHATVGDEIVVETETLDQGKRRCTVLEVIGKGDLEHYLVRWEDGHESIFYPGPDARVHGRAAE